MGKPKKRKILSALMPSSSVVANIDSSLDCCNFTEFDRPPLSKHDQDCSDVYDTLRCKTWPIANSSLYDDRAWNNMPPSSWLVAHHTTGQMSREVSEQLVDLEKIRLLHDELNSIKHQLFPVAVRCSDEWNHRSIKKQSAVIGYLDHEQSPQEFLSQARTYSNPFEIIGEKILSTAKNPRDQRQSNVQSKKIRRFVSRSALKVANIDALLGFQLTGRNHIFQDNGRPFFFVDLCGAPGGFSEYLLFRQYQKLGSDVPLTASVCKGWGMSLNGVNHEGEGIPWNLQHIQALYHGADKCFYVVTGPHGSGDVYDWENIIDLKREITAAAIGATKSTRESSVCNKGLVDLVLCDGGFNAQRDSECQESATSKLIVCETAAALELLKAGGNLCIKMFGFQTHQCRSVMTLLFNFFEKISVIKPISSRPASAERYVIGISFKPSHNWDAATWRAKVLSDNFCATIDNRDFYNYLNSADLCMLKLNIKACQCMLNFLNNCLSQSRGSDNEPDICHDVDAEVLNLYKRYARAWQLSS